MGDAVQIQQVPTQLVQAMMSAVDHAAPGRFEMGVNGCAELEDMLAAVLHSVGLYLIDVQVQVGIEGQIEALLPASPYERREAMGDLTGAFLAAVGVTAL